MSNTVVAFRTDLLGGRLLNLMHGWRLARRLDAGFIHIWPLFTKCREQTGYLEDSQPLAQIFNLAEHAFAYPELAFQSIDGMTVNAAIKLRERRLRLLPATPDDEGAYPYAPTEAQIAEDWPAAAFMAATPQPLPGDTRAALLDEAARLIHTLPLNGDLKQARKAVRRALAPNEFVAVHLRRGDITRDLLNANDRDDAWVRGRAEVLISRYAPDEAFHQALDERPGARPLLFSDSAAAIADFLRKRPDAVDARATLGPIAAEHGLSLMQADALELLTMSETTAVFGSGSNFAGFAGAYGGDILQDVRGRWTRPMASTLIDGPFRNTPDRVRSALAAAFDDWFAAKGR